MYIVSTSGPNLRLWIEQNKDREGLLEQNWRILVKVNDIFFFQMYFVDSFYFGMINILIHTINFKFSIIHTK